jgi:hypothetical protein
MKPNGAVRASWTRLARSEARGRFDPESVGGLPAPAQRFLRRAIAPGTLLHESVELEMSGSMRLQPGGPLLPMRASQILSPPRGFVWFARVRRGPMMISGYDRYDEGQGDACFKLFGLLTVAKGEGADVTRSAAARVAGEAVFVPAALLPSEHVRWEAVDDETARYHMRVGDEPGSCDLRVDQEGKLTRASIQRWREAAPGRSAGYQRFDVDQWSDERTFDGYTVQTRFRAGWRLGDTDEFPFFFASMQSLRFGAAPAS